MVRPAANRVRDLGSGWCSPEILHNNSAEVMADTDDDETGYEQELSRLHRREDLSKMHTITGDTESD